MSRWTHNICMPCWEKRNPEREPFMVIDEALSEEICCFCDKKTTSGIYVRHDPDDPILMCKGTHIGE